MVYMLNLSIHNLHAVYINFTSDSIYSLFLENHASFTSPSSAYFIYTLKTVLNIQLFQEFCVYSINTPCLISRFLYLLHQYYVFLLQYFCFVLILPLLYTYYLKFCACFFNALSFISGILCLF